MFHDETPSPRAPLISLPRSTTLVEVGKRFGLGFGFGFGFGFGLGLGLGYAYCSYPNHVQWLAAFDAARHVRVFSLDSFQLTATVPCLSSPPTAIGFSPSSDILAIASANKQA